MSPTLTLVHTRAEPRETYADIPQAARDEFFRLKAAVARMEPTFAGSYATSVTKQRAIEELQDMPRMALSLQRNLRSGK